MSRFERFPPLKKRKTDATKSSSNSKKPNPCDRNLWLVKVPDYLHEAWQSSPKDSVGHCHVTIDPSKKKNAIKFVLDEELSHGIPEVYELNLEEISGMKMAVMSETESSPGANIEGTINRRAELRPRGNVITRILNQPSRTKIQELSSSKKKPNVDFPRGKINEVRTEKVSKFFTRSTKIPKFLREDEEIIQERILSAFQKKSLLSSKELTEISKQPISFIKNILTEHCSFHADGKFKNMWELKPAFRCNYSDGYDSEEI